MEQLTLSVQLAALLAYLLGSVPFGLVLSRLAGHGDIRKIGSGNIGATNVLRTGNKKLALATLLLDGGKGAAAVGLASLFWDRDAMLVAGLFAVIGHNFPLWLKFKGGKGVASSLGVMLALAWPVGVSACLTWLAIALLARYSSLSALCAFVVAPFASAHFSDPSTTVVITLLAILGIARHHENIRRLVKGEESKIGGKKAKQEEQPPAAGA